MAVGGKSIDYYKGRNLDDIDISINKPQEDAASSSSEASDLENADFSPVEEEMQSSRNKNHGNRRRIFRPRKNYRRVSIVVGKIFYAA